jgi:ornithine carbamoyltransferase
MSRKHLLSVACLGQKNLIRLVNRSLDFAVSSSDIGRPLEGKVIGIYFGKPSTRTRTSFTVGALKLGAQTVSYGPSDLQLVTGETIKDTARVLSRYLDALVIRTNRAFAEMEDWADQDQLSIINGMSENEHPTQAIADLSTIKEAFGRFEGVHLLYLGEGNNTASALALAVAQVPGMKATFVTPRQYGLPESVLYQACEMARINGSAIEHHHCVSKLPRKVDAVYATRWQTMGEPHPDPEWRTAFAPYSLTGPVLREVSKSSGTIVLHDLPSVRGEDAADEVLDGQQSWVWRQAQHKMFSAMAVLVWCLEQDASEHAAEARAQCY